MRERLSSLLWAPLACARMNRSPGKAGYSYLSCRCLDAPEKATWKVSPPILSAQDRTLDLREEVAIPHSENSSGKVVSETPCLCDALHGRCEQRVQYIPLKPLNLHVRMCCSLESTINCKCINGRIFQLLPAEALTQPATKFLCHRVDTAISHSDRRPTKFDLSGLILRSEHCGHILVLHIVRHVLYRPYRCDSCHGRTRRRHVATSYWLATS